MQIFYLAIIVIVLGIIIFAIRALFIGKKSLPDELFSEALRNENSGNFVAAIATYEDALKEVQKIRFPDNNLRKSIIQKLKVLNTAIDYQNNVSKKTPLAVEDTEVSH